MYVVFIDLKIIIIVWIQRCCGMGKLLDRGVKLQNSVKSCYKIKMRFQINIKINVLMYVI